MSGAPHVVSGGASGIGRATVDLLLARGEAVVVVDRLPPPADLVERVAYVRHDLTDVGGLRAALRDQVGELPRVRSVVASAGLGLSEHFVEAPIDQWKEVVDTNISGVIALVQALTPALALEARSHGCADIVTIGSVVDENSYAGATVYGVTSAALKMLATHLRHELREERIRVANIAPGYVRSPWAQALTLTSEDYARLGPDLITIEDVAAIIDYVLHQPQGVVVHDLVAVSTRQGWG